MRAWDSLDVEAFMASSERHLESLAGHPYP